MTEELAQLIAIITRGNEFLTHGPDRVGKYLADTNVYGLDSMLFTEWSRPFLFSKRKRILVAESLLEWYEYVKANGCEKLLLYHDTAESVTHAKDHKLAGFKGGGGIWMIEACDKKRSNYWMRVYEKPDPEILSEELPKIQLMMAARKRQSIKLQADEVTVRQELKDTLTKIADFANKTGLQNWAEIFNHAKSMLDSAEPEKGYPWSNLIDANTYSLQERQLFYAAAQSWVFGGMGSWNDLSFENEDDATLYDVLSEQLYDTIICAFVAVVNAESSTFEIAIDN